MHAAQVGRALGLGVSAVAQEEPNAGQLALQVLETGHTMPVRGQTERERCSTATDLQKLSIA